MIVNRWKTVPKQPQHAANFLAGGKQAPMIDRKPSTERPMKFHAAIFIQKIHISPTFLTSCPAR